MTVFSDFTNNFKDKELLTLALTHRSWLNENNGSGESNERLEFLGDAILEFIISKELFLKFPNKEEGYLTALRSNLVNTINLSLAAKKLKLGSQIRMSKGEEETGGRENTSLLADTFEAVIGAIFLDQGLDETHKFIQKTILSGLRLKLEEPLKDPKSRLQEEIQAKGFPAPKYLVVSEEGPDHNKTFEVEVVVNGKKLAKGKGRSKSEAEKEAAEKSIKNVQKSL